MIPMYCILHLYYVSSPTHPFYIFKLIIQLLNFEINEYSDILKEKGVKVYFNLLFTGKASGHLYKK
ncbi:hypothetical protein HpBTM60_21480 [Helicobacter pylori]